METLTTTEKEICALIQRIEQDRGALDLVLSCARIFGLAKSLQHAPSSESVKAFLELHGEKLSVFLVNYILDVYNGKRAVPYISNPTEHDYHIDNDEQFLRTKNLNYAEFLKQHRFFPEKLVDFDEHHAQICQMVKVFIRIECQVKCKTLSI